MSKPSLLPSRACWGAHDGLLHEGGFQAQSWIQRRSSTSSEGCGGTETDQRVHVGHAPAQIKFPAWAMGIICEKHRSKCTSLQCNTLSCHACKQVSGVRICHEHGGSKILMNLHHCKVVAQRCAHALMRQVSWCLHVIQALAQKSTKFDGYSAYAQAMKHQYAAPGEGSRGGPGSGKVCKGRGRN